MLSHFHTLSNGVAVALALCVAAALIRRLTRPPRPDSVLRLERSDRLAENVWSFLALCLLIMMSSRLLLYISSVSGIPGDSQQWVGQSGCGVPLCVFTPDSQRYQLLTDYLSHQPLLTVHLPSLLQHANAYEAYLNADRNGVAYAYVSALLMKLTGISAASADSLVSFMSGLGLLLVVRTYLRERALPLVLVWVVAVLPIVTYYANANLKETWTVFLLVVMLRNLDRFRLRPIPLLAVGLGALALYYDRGYYLFAALGVFVLTQLWRATTVRSRLAWLGVALAAGYSIRSEIQSETPFLRHVFTTYNPGASFGSVSDALHGLPSTLFAINIFSGITLALYLVYLAELVLLYGRFGARGLLRGIGEPYLLVFLGLCYAWTISNGGGYVRGRDAMAPLLVLGLARLWAELRAPAREVGAVLDGDSSAYTNIRPRFRKRRAVRGVSSSRSSPSAAASIIHARRAGLAAAVRVGGYDGGICS